MKENRLIANNGSSIVLYTTDDGNTQLEVKLEKDTVWLTQSQMAELFGRDRTVVSRHIRNIFKEGELDETLVCAKNAQPKKYGRRDDYIQLAEMTFYNLDVIISVGYRVKSINGTKFRIWANSILKQYLIKGYAIDQRRLDHYDELKDVVRLMSRALTLQDKVSEGEYAGLFNVITDYVYALDTLDRYDYQTLGIEKTTKEESFRATYENAIKAAMLLYLVVKNHSFSDGNKRIAAILFLWFMEKNGILYSAEGRKRIADNTLVALTLMIAESRTEEKDVMVKVVVNLINKDNQ
ncbi:MAG: RhuM family protein [Parabacteroides sp.]|nr:RhuM family protein [Parabacteroides sp.]